MAERCGGDLTAPDKRRRGPREKPPFLGLLVRATFWMPFGVLLSGTWLLAAGASVVLPILGAMSLWFGAHLEGIGYFLAAAGSFLLARFIKQWIWENPSSLL